MAVPNELTYEENKKGERVLVKSIESTARAYLRFTNRTNRPVNIWWRDFNGKRRHYLCIEPGAAMDINSYITHPWEFSDKATNENYMINNKMIFRPPINVGGMMYRTNWNITVGLRSLRHTVLLSIAMILKNEDDIDGLTLPIVLKEELKSIVRELNASL